MAIGPNLLTVMAKFEKMIDNTLLEDSQKETKKEFRVHLSENPLSEKVKKALISRYEQVGWDSVSFEKAEEHVSKGVIILKKE